MSDQHDRQVEQAAQQALGEIARLHEHAINAVREQYPAPVARHALDMPAFFGQLSATPPRQTPLKPS